MLPVIRMEGGSPSEAPESQDRSSPVAPLIQYLRASISSEASNSPENLLRCFACRTNRRTQAVTRSRLQYELKLEDSIRRQGVAVDPARRDCVLSSDNR
jgi:hypothetical protein